MCIIFLFAHCTAFKICAGASGLGSNISDGVWIWISIFGRAVRTFIASEQSCSCIAFALSLGGMFCASRSCTSCTA